MHLKNGTLLKDGTYRIERFIKSGGFGCTYEARHVYSDKKVAIKEFFVENFCNRDENSSRVTVGTQSKKALVERLKDKFVKEAISIWNLNHRGIVRVSDVFEENGTAYYVMDYIEGKSLEEKIKDKVNLSEEETLIYVRQVADTLRYIHSKNILHLDIKPGNIMIDEEDNAILIDFGASKQYDEVDGENTSTLLLKTPGYAPLEQMDNEVGVFFPATDIYALGATMYKMLTGITPPNAIKQAGKFKMQPLPDNISYNTRNAVEKAMQKDKEDRPQSIDEFLKLLDGDAKKEKKESLWKKWMRRKKNIVEEQSDIIVTVDEDDPEPRKNLIPILLAVILCIVGIVFVINITDNNDKYNDLRSHGSKNGHDWVDLGLPSGLKWATCNVGANNPEDYGNYYAWGETEPAPGNNYSESNCEAYGLSISKLQSQGIIDGDHNLTPSHDAARANWGGSWRLPTIAEMEELENRCTWKWTTQNGVKGYKVTGPNGNSIFLPAAGRRYGSSLYYAGEDGDYWSSTPDESDSKYAYSLYFYSSNQNVYWYYRDLGRSVRPVAE